MFFLTYLVGSVNLHVLSTGEGKDSGKEGYGFILLNHGVMA